MDAECWTIFLDDGGVMNDNRLRGPQWQRLLGEFLPPRLGGEAVAWAEANRVVAPPLWDGYLQRRFGRVDVRFADYERASAPGQASRLARDVECSGRCIVLAWTTP
jgi:hypothetical protein